MSKAYVELASQSSFLLCTSVIVKKKKKAPQKNPKQNKTKKSPTIFCVLIWFFVLSVLSLVGIHTVSGTAGR